MTDPLSKIEHAPPMPRLEAKSVTWDAAARRHRAQNDIGSVRYFLAGGKTLAAAMYGCWVNVTRPGAGEAERSESIRLRSGCGSTGTAAARIRRRAPGRCRFLGLVGVRQSLATRPRYCTRSSPAGGNCPAVEHAAVPAAAGKAIVRRCLAPAAVIGSDRGQIRGVLAATRIPVGPT